MMTKQKKLKPITVRHIDEHLRPLYKFLTMPNLAELMVNQFGEVYLEFDGKPPQFQKAPDLNQGYFNRLANILSNELSILDFYKKPVLSAKLPGGHRLQLNLGQFVLSGIGMSIRVARPARFNLEDFGADERTIDILLQAIEDKKNILISGGTFTGKTQCMNALAKLVPETDRILTAEDVQELDLDHIHNKVQFIVSRLATNEEITYKDVIDSITRMRPDRVWIGEMSIQNAWILLRLLNSGHGGMITTIHADSTDKAFDAIERNIQMAGFAIDGVRQFFLDTIDVVIQITRKRHPITQAYMRAIEGVYSRNDLEGVALKAPGSRLQSQVSLPSRVTIPNADQKSLEIQE